MNGGSLFSGVGGFDLGLERAGVRIAFQCEADPYRRRVLARHWPGVPCFKDVREVARPQRDGRRGPLAGGRDGADAGGRAPERDRGAHLDLLFGGFPCQDLSVAGARRGLIDGERSSLFFEFARIADALLGDGGWVLIENVPGLLSSNGGRDFAVLLATLGELGFHDLAWRVLDSRYLGVPQRRRRVFILARRSRGRRAAEVLLEPESGGGDFEAGREAGPRSSERVGISPALTRRYGKGTDSDATDATDAFVNALDRKGGGADDNDAQAGHLVAGTVRSHMRPGSNNCGGIVAHTLRAEGFDASEDGTGRGTPLVADGVRAPSGLPGRMDVGASSMTPWDVQDRRIHGMQDKAPALNSAPGGGYRGTTHVFDPVAERSDTCALDPRPDGPRYAACGDAVTVDASYWIGRRLMERGS